MFTLERKGAQLIFDAYLSLYPDIQEWSGAIAYDISNWIGGNLIKGKIIWPAFNQEYTHYWVEALEKIDPVLQYLQTIDHNLFSTPGKVTDIIPDQPRIPLPLLFTPEFIELRSQLIGNSLNVNLIRLLEEFALKKWQEYHSDRNQPVPEDLSSGCKFGSLLALKLLGGEIKGNWWHHWIEVNEKIVDLSKNALDTKLLIEGKIPPYIKDYSDKKGYRLPASLYTSHAHYMSADNIALWNNLRDWEPFVCRAAEEFKNQSNQINLVISNQIKI